MSRFLSTVLAVFLFFTLSASAWAQEKVCPKCNKAYPADAKFCLDDGSLLSALEKCPKCRAVRPGKARFCPACGFDFEKPASMTCAKCGNTSPPGTKFCTSCGAALAGGATTGQNPPPGSGGPAVRQWVEAVVSASSQYAVKLFARDQIVGAPNVERPGQDGKAWCPSMAKRGIESITVQFAKPVVPSMIRIYETASQGFVSRVDAIVDGREVALWEGTDSTPSGNPVFEIVPRSTPPRTNVLKITVDTNRTRGWTEIDAVELIAGGASDGGGVPSGGNESAAHTVDIGDGPLGVHVGSSLRYQVVRGRRTETLLVEVHHFSDRSVGLAWTASGDRNTAGYAQVRRTNIAGGAAYDDLFPDEQADTLEESTALWLPRRVYLEVLENNHGHLDIAGVGEVSLVGANHLTQTVAIDGASRRVQVVSVTIQGLGKVTLLDDVGNPLVLEMERNGFHMTLVGADSVGGGSPPSGVGGTGTGKPPVSGGTGNTPPDPGSSLPVFATPDACFEAWKAAVLAADAAKLAQCYVASERATLEKDAEAAGGIFDRYKESLEKTKYSIESKKEVGSQTVWVMEVRVREVFWTRKAKETLKFSREGASYRIQIEKDGF